MNGYEKEQRITQITYKDHTGGIFNRKRVKPNATAYSSSKGVGFHSVLQGREVEGLRPLFSEVSVLLAAVQPNLQEIIKLFNDLFVEIDIAKPNNLTEEAIIV